MLIDYHTHHERCGHAIGNLREYVEYAIKLGLDQIGLSDHMPIIHLTKDKILPGVAMELYQLEEYVTEVLDLKKEYQKDIEIKLGLEADYIRGYEEKIEKLLSPYPFDYILGSIHFLGEWDLSDSRQMEGWKQRSIDEIFTDYYLSVQNAAKSGLYDIIGHFDIVKKYGHRPQSDINPLIETTLNVIRNANMAMEINVSGLYKISKEIFPAPGIVEKAISLGIPFTLGSDAHKPEHIHRGIEEGRMLLKKLGVSKLATFNQRNRIMVNL
ncbi:histidinol-phosphatase [Vulcanibacillus modesticaldus]|uniref:Histidinol-phosphatase n=1 Tax=Vulcanibacillus modesticaldus TaxID=337097 RepID=A0A1D2YSZ0_9BACI|nr:histidinol-phosphatase HisJ [Vulcanibacillus modesticaldus]OEF98824.1 histidinol-phosphatase [Vulcanibacillus modesticaldus]